jgi:hypothetical protein
MPKDTNVENPIEPTNPIIPITPPQETPAQRLHDLLEQVGHCSLELIVLLIMTNSEGIGAMDNVSSNIKGITDETNVTNKVQTDLIDIYNALSKLEKELGLTKPDPKQPLTPDEMKTLGDLQDAYKRLFGSDGTGATDGDMHDLESQFLEKYPDLRPIIAEAKAFQKDLNDNYQVDGTKDTFNFGKDLINFDPNKPDEPIDPKRQDAVKHAIELANKFYKQKHPSESPTSLTTDPTTGNADPNPLETWTDDDSATRTLTSNQSQQDTTKIQGFMQLLQGYDGTAQQIIQLAAQQKTQAIQNQRVG